MNPERERGEQFSSLALRVNVFCRLDQSGDGAKEGILASERPALSHPNLSPRFPSLAVAGIKKD